MVLHVCAAGSICERRCRKCGIVITGKMCSAEEENLMMPHKWIMWCEKQQFSHVCLMFLLVPEKSLMSVKHILKCRF